MPRSRKTNRVPQNTSSADDVLRSTINGSASAWPPHLRGSSSASTPSAIPPHLRGLTTEEAASGWGASAASSTSGEATSRRPAAQKLDEPINPARAFPCTFADCQEAFPSETLLMRHKASPMSGHDYCKICKLDFEDDAAFHLHKMESEAHITCSICSEDFKSEGGLKRHGCGKIFLKGAALMSHIEKSQCPGINQSDFETQRALVAISMHNHSNRDDRDQDLVSFVSSTVTDSVVGGVRIDGLSILDNTESPDALGEPLPSFEDDDSSSTSTSHQKHPVRNKLYESNYPTLGSVPSVKSNYSNASTAGENKNAKESWVDHNFPDAPATPAPSGWQAVSPSKPGFLSTINPADGTHGHFRNMDLKRDHVTGFFMCPFIKCPHGPFETVAMVQEHLLAGIHTGVSHRCVGCLKVFKSPSALTAHMESASERCHVRESREFGNALSLISGGYLGVNGRHADGSIKIDSPEVPMPKW
ncbi:hypothetical protein MMC29_001721 [Sticta canariensis]|nr:hypothetical protein [Sticta canariensis]